jgi:hypothetical protein
MIKKIALVYWVITLVIYSGNILAQSKSYKIIDAQSKDPVPYVTIKSGNFLSVSDTSGTFMLPDSVSKITVSCVGYQTKTFVIDQLVRLLSLNPASYNLNEVLVKPLEFRDFKHKHAAAHPLNIEQNPFDANFFYREFTKINKRYIDFNEAFGLYHFEGLGNYSNVNSNRAIFKTDHVRSLNIAIDKKLGLHQVNWLVAANNISKYLQLNFMGFYDSFDWKIDKIMNNGKNDLVEILYTPKPNKINYLKSKQWLRRDFYASIIGSNGKVYIDDETLKLQKFIFNAEHFNKTLKGYNAEDEKFKILSISGELTFTTNENNKTVPAFLGCNVSYILKNKPEQIIEKRLEFYFSNYNLNNQSTKELEVKYGTEIKYEFPTRAGQYHAEFIFSENSIYNEDFWKKELPYPPFYDLEKVKSDLKAQGVDIYKKFKEFNNRYK